MFLGYAAVAPIRGGMDERGGTAHGHCLTQKGLLLWYRRMPHIGLEALHLARIGYKSTGKIVCRYLMALRVKAEVAYYRVVINSDQCRAARALLRMTQAALAEKTGLGVLVIKRFERGSDPRASTVNAIERALVGAGVTLIDDGAASPAGAGAGVRLTKRAEP
jgi:hypothetical protein